MLHPPFFTSQLSLRTFRPDDQQRMEDIVTDRRFSDDRFPEWFSSRQDIQEAVTTFLENALGRTENELHLAICQEQNGKLIGGISLKKQIEETSFNFFLDPAFRDHGFEIEATEKLITKLKEYTEIDISILNAQAPAHTDYKRSILSQLGFFFAGKWTTNPKGENCAIYQRPRPLFTPTPLPKGCTL